MSITFEDVTKTRNDFDFRNLNFRWSSKIILDNVSGTFPIGKLTGIIGHSGAGKTSLLNAISGYNKNGLEGNLKINGTEYDEQNFFKISSYVQQENTFQPFLTTYESMMYAVSLRSINLTQEEKQLKILDILTLLNLWEHKDTMVNKLSGGQRKLLMIALEIVNNNSIIFLDEPTSGLDIHMVTEIINFLKVLVKNGRTIICTIHQPSSSIVFQFDVIYMLSQGLCVYQGEPLEIVSFLKSQNFHCPTQYNPSDFIVEICEEPENIMKLSKTLCNGKISIRHGSEEILMERIDNGSNNIEHVEIENKRNHLQKSPKKKLYDFRKFFNQFWLLLCRKTLQISRNRYNFSMLLFHTVFCAISVSGLFSSINHDGSKFFSQVCFCLAMIFICSYTYCMEPVLNCPPELAIAKYEIFNRWYGFNPFFLVISISKIPLITLMCLIFTAITYYFSGFPVELWRITFYFIICWLMSVLSEGLGIMIAALFGMQKGAIIISFIMAPFTHFSIYGFEFIKDQKKNFFNYIIDTSYMRAGVKGVLVLMYYNRPSFDCNTLYCPFNNPKIILEYLQLTNTSVVDQIYISILTLFCYRVFSYFSIKYFINS